MKKQFDGENRQELADRILEEAASLPLSTQFWLLTLAKGMTLANSLPMNEKKDAKNKTNLTV